jgi:allophanate hydrolase subunit 2
MTTETTVTARDFKTMMCRVNRIGWQEMSRLGIDKDRSLEDLLIEAANDLLAKNGRAPVIEKRNPNRD